MNVAANAAAVEAENARREEELRALAHSTFLPDYLQGPLDPSRMELTAQERQWALDVKEAVEGLPDLDNVTDFMYAQIALVTQGDLEKAVERAYILQGFREEFDFRDNFEQGKVALDRFVRRHPGYILHFFFDGQRYLVVHDVTKFDITCVNSHEEAKQMLCGAFYTFHAIHPDLEAVRKGSLYIMECEGYLWKAPKMVNFRIFRMGFQDIMAVYPLNLYKMRFCNTGVLINTLTSMVRKYIPASIHSKFELGYQSEVRLDTICLVPNVEVATDRVVREMNESLKRRYLAEASFRL